MVDLGKTEPGVPVLFDQLDADPWLLNVRNGTVDLQTGEFRSHDRKDLLTQRWRPPRTIRTLKAPTWLRFLHEVFGGDEDLIGFTQRFIGYSLTGDISEHLLAFASRHRQQRQVDVAQRGPRPHPGDYGLQLDSRIITASAHDEHPTGSNHLRGARMVTTIETDQSRHLAEVWSKVDHWW